MPTLDGYPAIINALNELLRAEIGDNSVSWDRVVIPDDWVERFNLAEKAADSLIELLVEDVVPDDQLNVETTSREMSAVTALAEDGEIKGLIYSNTENGLILKEVLEACIEGDLQPLLQNQLEEEGGDEDEDEIEEYEIDDDVEDDEDEEEYF